MSLYLRSTTKAELWRVTVGQNVLGRDLSAASIRLPQQDQSVSRKHATLDVRWNAQSGEPPILMLTDTSSMGTKVNFQPIVKNTSTQVRPQDQICLGQNITEMVIEWNPLKVCTTGLSPSSKIRFENVCAKCMLQQVDEVDEHTSLIVTESELVSKATLKLLKGLAARKPFTSLDRLEQFVQNFDAMSIKTSEDTAMPSPSAAIFTPTVWFETPPVKLRLNTQRIRNTQGNTMPSLSQGLFSNSASVVESTLAVSEVRASLFDNVVCVASEENAGGHGDWIRLCGGQVVSEVDFARDSSRFNGKHVFFLDLGSSGGTKHSSIKQDPKLSALPIIAQSLLGHALVQTKPVADEIPVFNGGEGPQQQVRAPNGQETRVLAPPVVVPVAPSLNVVPPVPGMSPVNAKVECAKPHISALPSNKVDLGNSNENITTKDEEIQGKSKSPVSRPLRKQVDSNVVGVTQETAVKASRTEEQSQVNRNTQNKKQPSPQATTPIRNAQLKQNFEVTSSTHEKRVAPSRSQRSQAQEGDVDAEMETNPARDLQATNSSQSGPSAKRIKGNEPSIQRVLTPVSGLLPSSKNSITSKETETKQGTTIIATPTPVSVTRPTPHDVGFKPIGTPLSPDQDKGLMATLERRPQQPDTPPSTTTDFVASAPPQPAKKPLKRSFMDADSEPTIDGGEWHHKPASFQVAMDLEDHDPDNFGGGVIILTQNNLVVKPFKQQFPVSAPSPSPTTSSSSSSGLVNFKRFRKNHIVVSMPDKSVRFESELAGPHAEPRSRLLQQNSEEERVLRLWGGSLDTTIAPSVKPSKPKPRVTKSKRKKSSSLDSEEDEEDSD